MTSYHNFVNGQFIPSGGSDVVRVINPSTGAPICTVPDSTDSEVEDALAAASRAQASWAARPAVERGRLLHSIARSIRDNIETLAWTLSEEQGKTLALARTEVVFTADYFDYTAEWARRIEGEIIESDRSREIILLFRKPVGVVVGILPWNFPFFLIARKAAPALVTGNTIVLKPSEETPYNAVKFCELLTQIGAPPGVINVVHGRGATAGRALCSSRQTKMISFTGSVETGSQVMAAAAGNITKVNLELGGKAPAIVMGDAEIPLAVRAINPNWGCQSSCKSRLLV